MNYHKLLRAAGQAKLKSHSPYSRFRVGAALLTTSGKIFTGCNIETSSFGLTICAERTAIFKAVSEGNRRFKAIAIVSDADGIIPPCGACRQVLLDLAGNIDVVLTDGGGSVRVEKLRELLPLPFTKSMLKSK